MSDDAPADWFAFNDEGRPVAVARVEFYPTIASLVLEDRHNKSSPWIKYRDIRYVTDKALRSHYLDLMSGTEVAS